MAEIVNAIQQRNYELVRDRIANILALELPNQATLNSDTDLDPTIEIERFVPVKDTELPLVNVMLTRGNYDSYTAIQQDGTYMYHIDIYTKAKWSKDNRADKSAFMKLQRLTGVIQAILSDSKYSTLGFAPPSLSRVQVNSLKFADPANNKDASSSVMARIEFEVRVPETVEVATLNLIAGYDTSVLIGSTDEGYVFSGNNAPIPPPSCDPADVRNTDDTYTDSYPSGEISTIPNTLVILQDTGGTELSNNDLPSANPGGYNLVAPDGNVTVENSDNDTVDSGVVKSGGNIVFNAPDATYIVQYDNGTIIEQGTVPSGGSVTVNVDDPIVCQDANWQLLDSDGNVLDSGSIASGGSATITAPDATNEIYDTDSNLLYTETIPSGDTVATTIQNGDIKINNNSTFSILAEGVQNINLLDQDGNTIEVDSVSGDDLNIFLYWFQIAVLLFRNRLIADGAVFETPEDCTSNIIDIGETDYSNALAVITPNGYKDGTLYAIKPNDGSVDAGVVRGSLTTRFNQNGILETMVGLNTPMITWLNGRALIGNYNEFTQLNTNTQDVKGVFGGEGTEYTATDFPSGGYGDLPYQLIEKIDTGVAAENITASTTELTFRLFIRNISNEWGFFIYNITEGTSISKIEIDSNYNIISSIGDVSIEPTNNNGFYEVTLKTSTDITIGDSVNVYLYSSSVNIGDTFEVSHIDIVEKVEAIPLILTSGATETRFEDVITTTPPAGTTKIIEYFHDGTTNEITTIPATYEMSKGLIEKVIFE